MSYCFAILLFKGFFPSQFRLILGCLVLPPAVMRGMWERNILAPQNIILSKLFTKVQAHQPHLEQTHLEGYTSLCTLYPSADPPLTTGSPEMCQLTMDSWCNESPSSLLPKNRCNKILLQDHIYFIPKNMEWFTKTESLKVESRKYHVLLFVIQVPQGIWKLLPGGTNHMKIHIA